MNKKRLYAYSSFLNCNITCVLKLSDSKWLFRMCDSTGNPVGRVMIAGTKHSYFKWGRLYHD